MRHISTGLIDLTLNYKACYAKTTNGVSIIVNTVTQVKLHSTIVGDIANVFAAHPDWTIEILSPDQNQTKVISNILHCLNAGCQMGWLIDPAEKSVFAYPAHQQPMFLEESEQLLSTPEFIADLKLSVGELFSWLKPGNV
ncbi:Uma2 family endonuclease [Coleofasciculus sp. LEGE 07092]|nr:Uma2 family endonuclease [Coleofasciculus sp. LEGE 07081]MBE9152084.1 Uma2 family endonuclease [Coleofasciculus sp. LEGE 07092]